jgi:hypothetical protein
MYCPECGSDAESANFCPECGNDLRGLAAGEPEPGVCPDCGTEAGDAKYCPECGHQLAGASAASAPRPAPVQAARAQTVAADEPRSGASRQQRRQAERRAAHKAAHKQGAHGGPAPARTAAPSRGHTTWFIWGGFALAAVVVVLIVVVLGGGGGGSTPTGSTGTGATPNVTADTSGSYSELVTRANGLYDQGSAALQNNDTTAGQKYYATAARVYAAAWKKQAGDPGVGTDYATSLFYSGQTDKALAQVNVVLKTSPGFQTAYLNKGIFLKAAATDATNAGDSKKADRLLAEAKAALTKAVSIDANSDPGKSAAQELASL